MYLSRYTSVSMSCSKPICACVGWNSLCLGYSGTAIGRAGPSIGRRRHRGSAESQGASANLQPPAAYSALQVQGRASHVRIVLLAKVDARLTPRQGCSTVGGVARPAGLGPGERSLGGWQGLGLRMGLWRA